MLNQRPTPPVGQRSLPWRRTCRPVWPSVNALDENQRAEATLSERPGIQTGAGKDGVIPPIEGSRAAGWNDEQRQLLLDTIARWVGMLDTSSTRARLAEIQMELGDTYLAWHGDNAGGPVYFRIQGPSLINRVLDRGRKPSSFHLPQPRQRIRQRRIRLALIRTCNFVSVK